MRIKLELRSDAIPGCGYGTAGLVDTDISHDEFGLPIIPAKRIKGILRESARDLEDVNIFAHGRTDEIFGFGGDKIGTEFKISDGYPENYSEQRELLQFCQTDEDLSRIFNRETVLSFYTYARSQTSIDDEKGVAEKDTLRTFRVLKKGLVFYFDTEYPPEWQSDIETICKVTRKFGISRTRGMGELDLTIDKSDHTQNAGESKLGEDFEDEDLCRLNLSIHNIGQLIVTIQVGKDQISENYIPGTFILGTMANAFIRNFGLDFSSAHHHQDFRNIFLNGDVIFSNAYPADKSGKEPCYPCPVSIVKEKNRERCFDMANEFDFDEIVKGKEGSISVPKPGLGNEKKFVRINRGEVSTQSLFSEVAYHHQRPKDRKFGHAKEGDGKFFQFTVIKPSQHFISHITGKCKYIKVMNEIINKRKTFCFGKSKTAQYGRCEVEEISIEKPDGSYSDEWKQGEPVVFTLVSDMILRNEDGFVTPDPKILKDEIAEELKADKEKIEIKRSFLKFKQIGGYSGVWNMPKIQTPALAAGSVIVCKNNGNDLADVLSLENHSFGIRTEEGFGRIKVNWHGQDKTVLSDDNRQDISIPDNLEKSKDLIQDILYRRLEDALKNEAVQKAEETGKPPVTNSFISKMILFVNSSKDFDKLNEKFLRLKERAGKQSDKIASYLFLKETGKNKFIVNEAEFIDLLKELRDSKDISTLRDIIFPNAGMDEDFYENRIFELYQSYAIHLLTLLRLHKRKADNSAKRQHKR